MAIDGKQTPYFERRKGENIALITERYDEFGDIQITRSLLSEKTALRLLNQLTQLKPQQSTKR